MSQLRVGDVIELLLEGGTERAQVLKVGHAELTLKLQNGQVVTVCPADVPFRVIKSEKKNNKEESTMSNTTTIFDTKKAQSTVAQRPVPNIIDITEEDLMSSSIWQKVKLPSGRIVEATIRKVSARVAKLSIKDELGVRTFTVVPSTKGTGVYVVEKEGKEYEKDGEKRFAVILSCEGDANILVTTIARRMMEAYGLSFEEEEEADITIF